MKIDEQKINMYFLVCNNQSFKMHSKDALELKMDEYVTFTTAKLKT